MRRLEVVQIRAGEAANFAYLIFCPSTRHGVGVDPSLAPERLLEAVRSRGVTLDLVVNTHGHRDHTGGNQAILQATGARLGAHPADIPEADLPLDEGSTIPVGEGEMSVLHTPGHSPGSICLHIPGALITGDTLFVTFVGRADLGGSDPEALYRSLQRLASFPPETAVYPGHDYGPHPVSTIGSELLHNPYLQCADLESFLRLRMG